MTLPTNGRPLTQDSPSEPRHPIGVVSTRTGIPQDVLRAWERRYGTVVPSRSDTGRRLYSDADLRRLVALKRAVAIGRRIGDIAGLSIEELEDLILEDQSYLPAAPVDPAPAADPELPDADPETLLREALESIQGLDADRLRAILSHAAVALSPPRLRNDLIAPLMRITGERWREGTFRIANEHLATAVVRSFVGALRAGFRVSPDAPRLVVATLAGQRHELGALLATTAAAEVGWHPVYLGPDLPPEEIAAATRECGARVVALSLAYPASDPAVHQDLTRVGQLVSPRATLVVGGPAAASYAETTAASGGRTVADYASFQVALDEVGGAR
ncbi:MAG TPA: cobalamin B12-binding domain-containing protein [bacterium]|nr:cobalamin B12-binding domain-containing protein [bacterium]